MEQARFIKILQQLSGRQRQKYMAFLRSPYFNNSEKIIKLNELVFTGKEPLTKEYIYAQVYPDEKFDVRRLPDLMYKSLKLLQEFLTEEQFAHKTWDRKINLLGYIRENEMDELKGVVLREMEELRTSNLLRDSDYFFEEFQYRAETDKIFLSQARLQGEQSLQQKVDSLDLFYLAAKLRDSCDMMNRTRIFATGYDFHLLDGLLAMIKADFARYTQYPAISLYYRIILMLRDPENTSIFFELKEEVFLHIQFFSQDEQRSLYGYLQNYCIRQVNNGNFEFYKELLQLYHHMFDRQMMDERNKNLQWDLKNIVSTALRLGDYEWTHRIISEVKEKLPKDVRENAYNYNLANYYYETQEFAKAKKLLQTVEFTDVYYSLGSKSMLLKIYFEQEEEEAFYSFVAAFKAYLTRNKTISKDNNIIYNNLVKFARQVFAYKTSLPYLKKKNLKKIIALKDTIIRTKQVANLSWLVREIDRIVEH